LITKKISFSTIILLIIFLILGFLTTIGIYYQQLLKEKIYEDSMIVNNLGKIRGGIQRYTKFKLINKNISKIKNQVDNEFKNIVSLIQKHPSILPKECKVKFFSYLNNLNSIWYDIKTTKNKKNLIIFSEKAWQESDTLIAKFEEIHKYKFSQIIKEIDYFIISSVVFLLILIIITYAKIKNGLEIETIKDALTKTHNRFYFNKIYKYLINKFHKTNIPFSMLIVDIDNFKKINDTYGHDKGDEILKKFGEILNNSTRKTDFVFRYGGEEFVIIFPETDIEKAKQIVNRILKKIPQEIKIENTPVTFSGGLGEYRGENPKEFFEKVDKALYEAKQKGKNRIVVI